ncbi:hypothetical protein BH24ACI3_BH24ACI3_17580 [soil metagenome]
MKVIQSFLCIALISFAANGQIARFDPLAIDSTTLMSELVALSSKEEAKDPAAFAAKANELLNKYGLGYTISLDAGTCAKIREAKSKLKDPNEPIRLGTQLQSLGQERAVLSLPPPTIRPDHCGGCEITLPILQLSDSEFITRMSGHNIGFRKPSNFIAQTAILVDTGNGTIKQRWNIPFRAEPIGISHDETVIYLALPQPELKELSLVVFAEGVFQFATRAEAENGGLGIKDKLAADHPADDRSRTIRFKRWEIDYVIKFLAPCDN